MTSTINASTSAGIVQTADTSGVLALQTAGTTAVTIDASQNVGIGTNTPSSFGAGTTTLTVKGSSNLGRVETKSPSNTGFFQTDEINTYIGSASNIPVLFYQNNADRMRINSNGNLLIGCVAEASNETRIVLSTNSGTTRWSVGPWSSVPNNFYITPDSAAHGVYLSGTSATSWSGLSDERQKDIIEPIENAVDKVTTLRTVIGKYKDDPENTRHPFLIAQDVQAVLPEAVSVSNPETGYLGLSYTDVIPLLVAAIQELKQELDELKVKVGA